MWQSFAFEGKGIFLTFEVFQKRGKVLVLRKNVAKRLLCLL
jgi:hypothetical protein